MSSSDLQKNKFKKPKSNTATTHQKRSKNNCVGGIGEKGSRYPLLAKDSQWVDILQTSSDIITPKCKADGEEVIQLVECEDGPEMKPLALMFPSLLEEDPVTLEGMLNKVMSTTEVTKHLVGHKANFAFMKKVDRLIPAEKEWLESLTEISNSSSSMKPDIQRNTNCHGKQFVWFDQRAKISSTFELGMAKVGPTALYLDGGMIILTESGFWIFVFIISSAFCLPAYVFIYSIESKRAEDLPDGPSSSRRSFGNTP